MIYFEHQRSLDLKLQGSYFFDNCFHFVVELYLKNMHDSLKIAISLKAKLKNMVIAVKVEVRHKIISLFLLPLIKFMKYFIEESFDRIQVGHLKLFSN